MNRLCFFKGIVAEHPKSVETTFMISLAYGLKVMGIVDLGRPSIGCWNKMVSYMRRI